MQTTRRALLAGASATALYLFMPIPSAAPLDKEAFNFVVERIHTCLKAHELSDQHYLFRYCQSKTGIPLNETEWLDAAKVGQTVDRTLRTAFRALEVAAAGDYPFQIMSKGELSLLSQLAVLEHLPIAPFDYGNPEFIGALSKVAPHYLS